MRIMPIKNYTVFSNKNNYENNTKPISNPTFGAYIKKDIFQKTIEDIWVKTSEYFVRDEEGCIPLHYADLEEIKAIHKEFAKIPGILAKMHLTPNNKGNLLMHSALAEEMQEIHTALKKQPDIIAKIHTTRNNYGQVPLHEAVICDDIDKVKEILRALKEQPKVIAAINMTKDNNGRIPIDYVEEDSTDILREIHLAISNAALNSNLDTKNAIKLLKEFNTNGIYNDAIKALTETH